MLIVSVIVNIECSQGSPLRYHDVSHILQSQIGTTRGMPLVLHPESGLVIA